MLSRETWRSSFTEASPGRPDITNRPHIGLRYRRQGNMPTFVYMTRCDGCGQCVDICPSDIMHIDTTYRRAFNIEPNMCWECYACVKACPQFAIDCRSYAAFAPLGHSVRVRREERRQPSPGRSNSGTAAKRISFPRSEPHHGARSSHRLNTRPPAWRR